MNLSDLQSKITLARQVNRELRKEAVAVEELVKANQEEQTQKELAELRAGLSASGNE